MLGIRVKTVLPEHNFWPRPIRVICDRRSIWTICELHRVLNNNINLSLHDKTSEIRYKSIAILGREVERGIKKRPALSRARCGDAGNRTRVRSVLAASAYERSCRLGFASSIPGNRVIRALVRVFWRSARAELPTNLGRARTGFITPLHLPPARGDARRRGRYAADAPLSGLRSQRNRIPVDLLRTSVRCAV